MQPEQQNSTGTPNNTEMTTHQHAPALANEKQMRIENEPLSRDVTGWKWALTSIAILLSIFLYALDATIVAAIQPIIVTDFAAVDKLAWLSVALLLAATATNMVWGHIYTQFNFKWLYIGNAFLFEVGSAICGVSCSGLYVGVGSLIAVTTPMVERPLYVSATGIT
jgi:MFS family permease